jgi:hypothetical protein
MSHNQSSTIPANQLALLHAVGAHTQAHSGRSLTDHLLGSHALLRAWQAPAHVCTAALFHSIYGTNAFQHTCLPIAQRATLQACIGTEAEYLAYIFCSINRPQALMEAADGQSIMQRNSGELIAIPKPMLSELLSIEVANLIEQGGRSNALSDIFCAAVMNRGLLPAPTYAALKSYLSNPARQGNTKAGGMV